MKYEWDEEKRQRNIRRRSIDFVDLPAVFDDEIVVMEDDRHDYGEVRWVAFGMLRGILIAVVYTEPTENVTRFISARQTGVKREITMSKSETDWARLAAMSDDEIDFLDLPEVPSEMFAKAVVKRGAKPHPKSQLTLRLDTDVVDWLKAQGKDWQAKINLLLRSYMEEDQRQKEVH